MKLQTASKTYHFAFRAATYESSCRPCPGQHWCCQYSGFDDSNICVVVSYLICISLMKDDRSIFHVLIFPTHISSLMRCLLRYLAHFLTGQFVFFLLRCNNVLYTINNSPVSDMSFENDFSHSVICLILLTLSFAKQNFSL